MISVDTTYRSRLYGIWSAMVFGSSAKRLAELMNVYSTAEELYEACREGSVPADIAEAAGKIPLSEAERVLDICDKGGIGTVSAEEDEYPAPLREIYSPPPVLFYRGDISRIGVHPCIGVVGTRKPSAYSLKAAAAIVHTLAGRGFDIVSGFAEGTDICAHLECLKSGGRTYAVIGCGIDVPYPRNNMRYRGLIEENGAVISEFLPGTRPFPPNFPQRNRILAGLSSGIVVVEAGSKSGSLNSAAHAESQNKAVFAVPPCDIFDKRYMGNAALIRDGAVPLMGARDILGEYGINTPHIIAANDKSREKLRRIAEGISEAQKEPAEPAKPAKPARPKKPRVKKLAEREAPAETEKPSEQEKPLSERLEEVADPLQKKVLAALGGIPKRADELSEELETDIGDVLTALTELEISGDITVFGGNYRLS